MLRLFGTCLCGGILCLAAAGAHAQPDLAGPPVTYEVQINGESFQVEGNRMVKVEGKKGTPYELAVRISPTQHVRLNSVQFDYELPAKLTDSGPGRPGADGRRPARVCRIEHELGFNAMITDLNGPLEDKDGEKGCDAALKVLVDSVSEGYREGKVAKPEIGKSYSRKFAGADAAASSLRYTDARGYKHTCLLYVFSGKTFAASCVVQYVDKDAEGGDLLPLVRKTLDSIRGLR